MTLLEFIGIVYLVSMAMLFVVSYRLFRVGKAKRAKSLVYSFIISIMFPAVLIAVLLLSGSFINTLHYVEENLEEAREV